MCGDDDFKWHSRFVQFQFQFRVFILSFIMKHELVSALIMFEARCYMHEIRKKRKKSYQCFGIEN